MKLKTSKRANRFLVVLVIAASLVFGAFNWQNIAPAQQIAGQSTLAEGQQLASEALNTLPIKGRAPKTGYTREQFSADWGELGGCDMRNIILERDLADPVVDQEDLCSVLTGTLNDPYTGRTISFKRGAQTSQEVQIDHVVALSDAWQKGAQQLSSDERYEFANDPLNLLAVDGSTNQQKGDADAATWLPPNKDYRCRYVARQIAVKTKYSLWATQAEYDAMGRVLGSCPQQLLPNVSFVE